MGFSQRPIRKHGKVLSRSYRILFVFLKDYYGSATQCGLQRVVTKKTNKEQCRQEMIPSWSCIGGRRHGEKGVKLRDIGG